MTEVISVRFRGGCKEYDFDPQGLRLQAGDEVIVETAQGSEFAVCSTENHEVDDEKIVRPLCSVLRLATDTDRNTVAYNRKREKEAFGICEKKIAAHGLEMKLVNVNCSFDSNKIIFFFTADGRVDFRELVRDLAGVFRARIELRQIGVRDEAKMIGGLGICGRPFCCSQFLDGFMPVSIKMAKTQNLSLNPTKISGTCGRLMCCLKYEQNAYEDAAKRMPKNESFVQTPDGPGNVKNVDLIRERVKVSLDSAPEPLKCYHNCEICVLRNGKGSREGIEVPAERPARFIEPKQAEEAIPAAITSFYVEEFQSGEETFPTGESEERARRQRRSRSRRNGGFSPEGAREPRGEGGNSTASGPERTSERPTRKPAGSRPSGNSGRSQQNGGKSRSGAPFGNRSSSPQTERQGAEGEDKGRRRPHHRGGGRRGRGGGSNPNGGTPSAE